MRNILLVIYTLIISGCMAMGEPYTESEQPAENEGIVYIYRPSVFYVGGTYPYVFIDGEKKFKLKNNGYNFVKLSPGKHTILIGKGKTWQFKDAVGEIEIEPKKTYYIRVLPRMSGVVPAVTPGFGVISVSGSCSVQSMAENDAVFELKETRLTR